MGRSEDDHPSGGEKTQQCEDGPLVRQVSHNVGFGGIEGMGGHDARDIVDDGVHDPVLDAENDRRDSRLGGGRQDEVGTERWKQRESLVNLESAVSQQWKHHEHLADAAQALRDLRMGKFPGLGETC